MTEIKLNRIEIDGVSYPLYCDLNVLGKAQEEFESINQFERDLGGLEIIRDDKGEPIYDNEGYIMKSQGEPKIKAVSFALRERIREGQKVEERQDGIEPAEITGEELIELCDIDYRELSFKLHQEFNRCFESKKKKKVTKTSKTRTKKSTI